MFFFSAGGGLNSDTTNQYQNFEWNFGKHGYQDVEGDRVFLLARTLFEDFSLSKEIYDFTFRKPDDPDDYPVYYRHTASAIIKSEYHDQRYRNTFKKSI
ncbi:hypothetical protein Q5O24_06970 [Eubacteriaceae bacterium ES3]|nr:hypothetical protein Q5O24_06970 [Eubacteriaceae bacterium ES3]